MTKQEVLDALNCINCHQDGAMCDFYSANSMRNECQSCMGHDSAMPVINDFVDLMVDKLDDAVDWHPYPEEKPSCGEGRGEEQYLVSTNADTVHEVYWEKFNGGF